MLFDKKEIIEQLLKDFKVILNDSKNYEKKKEKKL
jgi:hypothetical protein